MLQTAAQQAYNHLEQGPKFPKVDIWYSGLSLPTRAPNRLQSIINRWRPVEMPKQAFCLDYSQQSSDSGDRLHCNDRHHFYSGKCSVTQRTIGDQKPCLLITFKEGLKPF